LTDFFTGEKSPAMRTETFFVKQKCPTRLIVRIGLGKGMAGCHRFWTPMSLNSSALNWDRYQSPLTKASRARQIKTARMINMVSPFFKQFNDFWQKKYHFLSGL